MKWGPRRSGWTQPTGTGGKKRNFARYTSAKHFESPIRLVANRAAGTSCAAHPLNILDTLARAARHGVFEFASAPGRGAAVRAMLPIPAQLAAASPVGPGVAAGEPLFQENNWMGNQRSDLTWASI